MWRKAKGDEFLITADIGSSRVVGALIRMESSEKPEILYTAYREIGFQGSLDAGRYSTRVASTLEACLSDIRSNSPCLLPARALITLSSLIYEPKILSNRKTFATETKVTAGHLKELSGTEQTAFDPKVIPLESTIMRVMLNGYPTAQPAGKLAHRIDTAVYTSTADKDLLEQIKETFARLFPMTKIEVHPFSFSAFAVIRDIVQDQNFVCMDFGGEITDIIVAKNSIIEKTISIPFGKNSILRELMDSMQISLELAESSLILYNQGAMAAEASAKIANALDRSRAHWETLFLGTLEHITLDLLLPQDVYVLSSKSIAPVISSFIKNEEYNRYTFVGQQFIIHEITDKTLLPYFKPPTLSTVSDPFVMISSLFSAKLN